MHVRTDADSMLTCVCGFQREAEGAGRADFGYPPHDQGCAGQRATGEVYSVTA